MADVTTKTPRRRTGGRNRAWHALGLLLLFLLPVVGGLAGFAVASVTPLRYTAHAYVLITTTATGTDQSARDIAQAVARVATNESVLAAGGSGSDLRYAARNERLTASSSPDAPLIDLSATSDTPRASAVLADELAETVQAQVTSIAGVVDVKATLFAPASKPTRPSAPNTLVDVLVGVALGVIIASVGLVLARR